MSKVTNSTNSIRALTILRQVLWVARRNIPVFSLWFGVSIITSLFLSNVLADMTTSNDVSKFKYPSLVNIAFLAKVIFDIMLLKAALVYTTSQTLQGKAATIREVYSKTKSYNFAFSAIKLIIIATIYLFGGIACAFVGIGLVGLMLYLTGKIVATIMLIVIVGIVALIALVGASARYYVVIPVVVIEETGILEGFSRSSQLTRGHKWGIVRLFLLMTASIFVLSFGIGVSAGIAVVVFGVEESAFTQGSIVNLYVFPLIGATVTAILAALDGFATTVCYNFLNTQANEVAEESGPS